MARKITGQVIEDPRRQGVYGLRFRAYGKRHYQGLGKVSRGEAEAALRHVLADVERGVWRPATSPAGPAPLPGEVKEDPTFREFASEWFENHKGEWRPKTRDAYAWQLSSHLLPYFAGHRLTEITIREVDRYRAVKVSQGSQRTEAMKAATEAIKRSTTEGERKRHERELRAARELPGISAESINKTITRLGQILEVAKEYKLIPDNPTRGRNRRLKVSKPAPVWIDRPEHAAALLDAAAELDQGGALRPPARSASADARDAPVRRAAARRADRASLARRRPRR